MPQILTAGLLDPADKSGDLNRSKYGCCNFPYKNTAYVLLGIFCVQLPVCNLLCYGNLDMCAKYE